MRRRTSRGHTLIELTVVVGMVGVMIGLLGMILQTVLHVSRQHSDREAETAMLMRLDTQFRTDVHGSNRATLTPAVGVDEDLPSDHQLVLDGPGRLRIDYRCADGRLQRTVTRLGKIENHDAFHVGRHARYHFAVDNGSGGKHDVRLVIELMAPHAPDRKKPKRTHRIIAVLGGGRSTLSEVTQ